MSLLALLAASGIPLPDPDPTPTEGYRQIASRTGVATFAASPSAGIPSKTERVRHVVAMTSTDPKVSFSNLNLRTVGLNPITVGAAIEVGGTIYQFKFGGASTITLAPGDHVTSDPIVGLTVPAGNVYTRTYVAVTSDTLKFPMSVGVYFSASAGEGTNSTTTGANLTAPGSAAPPVGTTSGFAPLALSGLVTFAGTPPSLAIIGDSISESVGDNYQNDPTHSAFAVRGATAAGVPYINYAVGGDTASGMNDSTRRSYWFEALETCTHAICGYAINDLSNSTAAPQIYANNINLWTYLKGRGLTVRQATCTPRTNSTDSYATLANQTVVSTIEPNRLAWNAWLRDGAPMLGGAAAATGSSATGTIRAGHADHPLNGIVDSAATVEASGGKWIVGTTTEGLHPSPTGYGLMAPPVTTWLTSITS